MQMSNRRGSEGERVKRKGRKKEEGWGGRNRKERRDHLVDVKEKGRWVKGKGGGSRGKGEREKEELGRDHFAAAK